MRLAPAPRPWAALVRRLAQHREHVVGTEEQTRPKICLLPSQDLKLKASCKGPPAQDAGGGRRRFTEQLQTDAGAAGNTQDAGAVPPTWLPRLRATASHPLDTDWKVASWVPPSTQTGPSIVPATPRKAGTGAHMASVDPEAGARLWGLESTRQMPKEATWGFPVPSEEERPLGLPA